MYEIFTPSRASVAGKKIPPPKSGGTFRAVLDYAVLTLGAHVPPILNGFFFTPIAVWVGVKEFCDVEFPRVIVVVWPAITA
jgi:hypothetical protein